MKQSNTYVLLYTIAVTSICGALLAVAAIGLKPRQDANIAFEKRQNILATVMKIEDKSKVDEIYKKRVKAYVLDYNGEIVKNQEAEKIDIAAEYKKEKSKRLLPIYEIVDEKDPQKTDFYVIPVYGFGLWDNIWGFISLKGDFNTINGVKFKHKAETPGLGARIESNEVQSRFEGKQIFDKGGRLVAVKMMKGEHGGGKSSVDYYKENAHQVDGMSGATLTGAGVNNMMNDYLQCYEKFIKVKSGSKVSLLDYN
jgi:Na+-transporting NADH:ubiquinone oxidoreductase subunit C